MPPCRARKRTAVRRRGYWAGNHPGDPRFQVREGPGSARARYSIGCTSKFRPAMSHFFLEPNRGRRRTAVRFRSRRDARSADLTFFPSSSSASFRVAGAPAHRPGPVERRVQEALEKDPRRSTREAGCQGCQRRRCDRAPRDGGGRTRRRRNDAKRSALGERRAHVLRAVPGGYDILDRSGGAQEDGHWRQGLVRVSLLRA